MSIPANSMSANYIARYDSEIDAGKAAKLAQDKDTHGECEYLPVFSNHAQKWLVAVHDAYGNLRGFLHHILD